MGGAAPPTLGVLPGRLRMLFLTESPGPRIFPAYADWVRIFPAFADWVRIFTA